MSYKRYILQFPNFVIASFSIWGFGFGDGKRSPIMNDLEEAAEAACEELEHVLLCVNEQDAPEINGDDIEETLYNLRTALHAHKERKKLTVEKVTAWMETFFDNNHCKFNRSGPDEGVDWDKMADHVSRALVSRFSRFAFGVGREELANLLEDELCAEGGVYDKVDYQATADAILARIGGVK